jgi:hypothetical protein
LNTFTPQNTEDIPLGVAALLSREVFDWLWRLALFRRKKTICKWEPLSYRRRLLLHMSVEINRVVVGKRIHLELRLLHLKESPLKHGVSYERNQRI